MNWHSLASRRRPLSHHLLFFFFDFFTPIVRLSALVGHRDVEEYIQFSDYILSNAKSSQRTVNGVGNYHTLRDPQLKLGKIAEENMGGTFCLNFGLPVGHSHIIGRGEISLWFQRHQPVV